MLAALAWLALGPQKPPPPAYPGYKLVWHDEFDTNGPPNPKNWVFEHGFVRNRELQWYKPQNAFVTGGRLIIEGRRDDVPNPKYVKGSSDWKKSRKSAAYSSACIETRGLHAWTYGRFEFSAKIDTRLGSWPAIWFVGTKRPWPQNGEIDLMEYYQNTLHANTAWGDNSWNEVRMPLKNLQAKDPQWSNKFHVWRMDWDQRAIKLYCDGQLLNDTPLSETINPDGSKPFSEPHSILINLALGSTGGDVSKTALPALLQVEYARVYQRY